MFESTHSLMLSAGAALLFGFALYVPPLKIPFGRAAIRIAAFALFTASLLYAGISPNRALPDVASAVTHSAGQCLIGIWWFGGAAVLNSVVRATLRIRHRPERERLVQDVATTGAYLLATLEVSSKVFGLPVGALLATSGAVAIVVGLALQSALGDAFGGLMLNFTRPYRIGDWIVVDATLEGRVIETNWRATHLLTADRDIAVVPNSTLAKARFINTSVSSPIRGMTVRLQLAPDVRPATATTALERATHGHEAFLLDPAPQITIRSSTVEAVEYEVRLFASRHIDVNLATTRYLDLAYRHLDSLGVDRRPPGAATPAAAVDPFENRLIRGAPDSPGRGACKQTEAYAFAAGETFVPGQHTLDGQICVSTGVLSVRLQAGSEMHEVARLNPGDYWVKPNAIDNEDLELSISPLTDCKVLVRVDSPPTQAIAAGANPSGSALAGNPLAPHGGS